VTWTNHKLIAVRLHFIQLVVYSWLLNLDLNKVDFLLFNIKTNEIIKIKSVENIEKIIGTLVYEHFIKKPNNLNDSDFIQHNN